MQSHIELYSLSIPLEDGLAVGLLARYTKLNVDREEFPVCFIYDIQRAEPPTAVQGIMHEA